MISRTVLTFVPEMLKEPVWLKPNNWLMKMWLYSPPNLKVWLPFDHVTLSASWNRRSNSRFCPRKFTVPYVPIVSDTFGSIEFAIRGRSSRTHWPRNSLTMLPLSRLMNCPTTEFELSFSVPLFDSALLIVGNSAFPTEVELSASMLFHPYRTLNRWLVLIS